MFSDLPYVPSSLAMNEHLAIPVTSVVDVPFEHTAPHLSFRFLGLVQLISSFFSVSTSMQYALIVALLNNKPMMEIVIMVFICFILLYCFLF